ncbi:MAG: iron ABC transporter permease [Sphingomonadaceae bacterium]|nr:iron ABC transporter permease [Sphingomonadaceae bacterium]
MTALDAASASASRRAPSTAQRAASFRVPAGILGGLALLTAALFAASLAIGPVALTHIAPDVARTILVELRLPRACLALLIGAGLGASGAAVQGLTRNPLASPDVTGVSAGAALGAVLAAYYLPGSSTVATAAGALGGAALALALLLALAGRGASAATLVLAGAGVSALLGALTSLALSLAPSPYALYDALTWLFGSLADRSLVHLAVAAPLIIVGTALLCSRPAALDALALGEDVAATLGHRPRAAPTRVLIGSTLAVGGGVAVAGAIGFVGLIVPHLVRPLTGHLPGRAVLPSALAGAALVLAADLLTRAAPPGPELKLGVLTTLVGAPFLVALVLRGRADAPR